MPSVRRLPSGSPCVDSFHRWALVIGHPGHELKVFGWMSEYKPRVYVITDGSGRHGIPRISSTAALLDKLGACPGEIFGAISDAELYAALLARDFTRVLRLVDELAGSFLKHHIDCVAGDAAEGFNPTHDLCRMLINAAVLLGQRTNGKKIANFEFTLTEWEQACPEPPHDSHCLHWTLDDRLLLEKIAAAEQYIELKNEVRQAIARRGEAYFRGECLRRVVTPVLACDTSKKPFYETWGERRVLNGEYQSVIRLKQHVLPLVNAIFHHATQGSLSPVAGARPD